jgi:hypothetical protein
MLPPEVQKAAPKRERLLKNNRLVPELRHVVFFNRYGATTLAFARVLAGATIVARLAAAIAFARVLTLTIVLGAFRLDRLGVVCHEFGSSNQTGGNGSESDSELSAVH